MDIFEIIKTRRSIFPVQYTENQPIKKEDIELLLELANYAPTHKLTQPWRFRVLQGPILDRLADTLVAAYTEKAGEKFSQLKANKMNRNPRLAGAIVALGLKPNPELLPEWEEMAALSMAVQNMWLGAHALGLGAYWASPGVADAPAVRELLEWEADVKGFGFLYLGHYEKEEMPAAQREPIADKVRWL